ncbi:FecR/PupR family sigma factor regulator [Halomonas sp. KM-1]|uniref:FecR/PupR family sigma factor regulator n=1 Tax=Halomonas sp. KM-1 TaxID=590061 RepID=UPI0019309987|nr:FecR/PupR family sigma factor regulator [Halomonas sp. KM-1]
MANNPTRGNVEMGNGSDAVWQAALDWLMLMHDGELDDAGHRELHAWLAASPTHREAFREAERLWTITGLVPPKDK